MHPNRQKQQPAPLLPLPESHGKATVEATGGGGGNDDPAADFLAAMQGERRDTVSVYRQGLNGINDVAFLFSEAVAEMGSYEELLTRIGRDYGPGEYRVKLRQQGRITANQLATIAAPRAQPGSEPAPAAAAAPGMTGLAEVITVMQQMQARSEAAQARADERYTRLLETLVNRREPAPAPAGAGVGEVLKMAEAMVNMTGANRGTNPMSQVKEFLEIRELLASDAPKTGANENDLMLEGLKSIAPALAQVAVASMANPPAPPQARPQPRPAAITQAPAVPSPPRVAPGVQVPIAVPGLAPNLMNEIRSEVAKLVKAAERGSDTGAYAVVLGDTYPEAFIRAQLLGETALRRLMALVPAIVPHRQWFMDLQADLAAYLDALNAPDEGGESEDREGEDHEGGRVSLLADLGENEVDSEGGEL